MDDEELLAKVTALAGEWSIRAKAFKGTGVEAAYLNAIDMLCSTMGVGRRS